jgi:serine/threonine protein kinase
VKVMLAHHQRDGMMIQRFLREARLASRFDHPFAAHIYEFGAEEDGLLWIAMERVHGVTLSQWIAERGPIPLGSSARSSTGSPRWSTARTSGASSTATSSRRT